MGRKLALSSARLRAIGGQASPVRRPLDPHSRPIPPGAGRPSAPACPWDSGLPAWPPLSPSPGPAPAADGDSPSPGACYRRAPPYRAGAVEGPPAVPAAAGLRLRFWGAGSSGEGALGGWLLAAGGSVGRRLELLSLGRPWLSAGGFLEE